MKIPFFTLDRQNIKIGPEIKKAISEVVDSGRYVNDKKTKEFEEKWAAFNNQKYCLLTSSGTTALELAIKSIKTEDCKNVITTSNSFIATSSAICANNLEPWFLDTGNDCNLNLGLLEEVLKSYSPKAFILNVDLYGNPINYDILTKLSKNYKRYLILDLAQAHGSTWLNELLATYGDISCMSFYVSKTLGTLGEAGCILTNNLEIYEKCKSLRNHGRGKDNYSHDYLSGNNRNTEINAAILLVKLKYLSDWIFKRAEIRDRYIKNLNQSKNIKLLDKKNKGGWIPYVFPIFVQNRNKIKEKMNKLGVECAVHYPTPMPLLECYKNRSYYPHHFPNCYKQCNKVLTLPTFPELENDEIDFVSEKLLEIV